MTSCRFHVAPPLRPTSATSVMGGPPLMTIFLMAPFAKKPRTRPSGDQNGESEFSVPGSGDAAVPSSDLIQIALPPFGADATRASCFPSGESANIRSAVTLAAPRPVIGVLELLTRSTDAR